MAKAQPKIDDIKGLTQWINFLWLKLKDLFSAEGDTTNDNYLPKINDVDKKLVKSNIQDDGETPKYGANTIWHSGNGGSLSELDADLLDGKHASDFADVDHDHDTAYLGINATAADSELLDGNEASYFATSTHNHDSNYLGIDATAADSEKLGGELPSYYEPAFDKNTAFNKDFGTGASDVARGDHGHSDLHSHDNKDILDDITAAFTTELETSYDGAVTNSHTHANATELDALTQDIIDNSHTHDNLDALGDVLGVNTGDEDTTTIGSLINEATAKTTPANDDMVGLMDSADSNILKKLSWSKIKDTLKTYFDALYAKNSIANITVGTVDVVTSRDSTIELIAGTNISLTADNIAKKITIAATGGGGGGIPTPYNDFDGILDIGSYKVNGMYSHAPNQNCGTSTVGTLVKGTLNVFRSGVNDWGIIQQLFWVLNGTPEKTEQYQRSYNGTTFTDWKRLIKCDDYAGTGRGGIISEANLAELFRAPDLIQLWNVSGVSLSGGSIGATYSLSYLVGTTGIQITNELDVGGSNGDDIVGLSSGRVYRVTYEVHCVKDEAKGDVTIRIKEGSSELYSKTEYISESDIRKTITFSIMLTNIENVTPSIEVDSDLIISINPHCYQVSVEEIKFPLFTPFNN